MKKLLHKSLSFVLVFTLILSLFSGLSFHSSAADLPSSGRCGENVTYTFNSSTGKLVISGSGAMYDYSFTGSPFYKQTGIKVVVINSGVTSIGSAAFSLCSGLTSIAIPDSVTSIGNSVFYNCSGLTSITIPDSVTSIGVSAFYNCSGLTSITIPNSVTSIDYWAFAGCSGFTSITIPNSVTSIGSGIFEYCNGLTSITIPDSVTSIGNCAFYGCSGITNITIPNSVTNIGDCAFYGCHVLTNITIPDSITSIGNQVFEGCSGVTSIVVDENNPAYDSRNSCNAIIETKTNTLVFGCKNTLIPNSVTSIGDRAFYNCSSITNFTIPNSVTSIGSYAFEYCNGLTSVTIPNSVTSIGSYAFKGCGNLKSIDIQSDSCYIYYSEGTIPQNTTIIINGSKHVYNYAVKYNRNYVCNHIEEIDSAKEPTCTVVGLTAGSHCKACGVIIIQQEVSALALGHTPAEAVVENEVASTCIKSGSSDEVIYCSVCKQELSRETKTILALGHDYQSAGTAPTCTKRGFTTYTCKRCSDTYVSNYIDALGHTPTDAVRENELAPTCAKSGSYDEVVYCSVCSEELSRQTKSVAKLAHTPAESVRKNEISPTCTKAGSYDEVVYCTVCKQELSKSGKSIPKLGHDLQIVETIAPTYTEKGYDVLKCQRADCDYSCHGNFVPPTLETISVSLQSPITLLERADARCYDRTDLAAMQQYGEFYYEYNYSIFKPGNAITLTATDGTKEVFTYSEDTGEFMNAEGEGIYPTVTDTQSETTPWTVGTNYFTVSYDDKSVSVPVTIRKNPIVQIAFMPKNPYIYTQYADGDWDTYQASEFDAPVRYFRYDLPTFKTGDRLAVSYDDGVLHYNTDYTYDETKKAFVSATGESISGSEIKCGYRGGNCLDWTIGERGGWFEFTYLGCTTYAGVKIRENYVQSIAFTPLKPYEVIEGNSKEHFKKWDEKTETYIEGDYYDAFDIYVPGNQLTVNYKNGSSDTFTCLQTNDGLVFANAGGEVISPKSVSNQYQKPWTLGSNNTFTVKWSGAEVSVPVTMVESPISDIVYTPAKPVVLEENTGGYYRDNDWYHGKVFFYHNPLFKEGDELLLYFKTGSTKKYTAKAVNGEVDFYDIVGNPLEGILWVDDNYQYENPWQLGDYNACVVKYMGQSCAVSVSVIKGHSYIESIIKQPTCEKSGLTQAECIYCGEKYTQRIPPLGHRYVLEYHIEGACDKEEQQTIVCRECGKSHIASYSAKHTARENSVRIDTRRLTYTYICEHCEAAVEKSMDVNGDNVVDIADVSECIAAFEKGEERLDINSNCCVDIQDVCILLLDSVFGKSVLT